MVGTFNSILMCPRVYSVLVNAPLIRTYTTEFGRSILDVYTSHLGSQRAEPRRDLWFKPQVEFVGTFDDIDVFNAIPMGDIWDDASLLGPLKYLMTSSKVRWGGDASKYWVMVWWGGDAPAGSLFLGGKQWNNS